MAPVHPTAIRPDHNALGKASFVTAIIALVMSFVPVIGLVAWLLAPLAVLFGLIALGRPSRSLAVAGVVVGAIALFVCFSWIKGVQSVGRVLNADTFNNRGDEVANPNTPLMIASIRTLWSDLEENKIAAGRKYGGHRLMFHDEKIADFSGKADSPSISFVGKSDDVINQIVSAAFSDKDGDKIGTLRKGQKISFTCENIAESLGGGYSLSNCSLS